MKKTHGPRQNPLWRDIAEGVLVLALITSCWVFASYGFVRWLGTEDLSIVFGLSVALLTAALGLTVAQILHSKRKRERQVEAGILIAEELLELHTQIAVIANEAEERARDRAPDITRFQRICGLCLQADTRLGTKGMDRYLPVLSGIGHNQLRAVMKAYRECARLRDYAGWLGGGNSGWDVHEFAPGIESKCKATLIFLEKALDVFPKEIADFRSDHDAAASRESTRSMGAPDES